MCWRVKVWFGARTQAHDEVCYSSWEVSGLCLLLFFDTEWGQGTHPFAGVTRPTPL